MKERVKRTVKARHAFSCRKISVDETNLITKLREEHSREDLLVMYGKYVHGMGEEDALMRSAIWRVLCRSCGENLQVGTGVLFRHIETFEIGDNVFIGPQSYVQGREAGRCKIGNRVWLGPQSYLDARDLVIEDSVGWGPGARLLGSQHIGIPVELPLIETDLEIKPVSIKKGSDIGTSAVILPGVTVGEKAIVGAGAVVTKDVEPFSIVVGVPARFLRWRKGNGDEK